MRYFKPDPDAWVKANGLPESRNGLPESRDDREGRRCVSRYNQVAGQRVDREGSPSLVERFRTHLALP